MTHYKALFIALCWLCLFTLTNAGGICRGKTTCRSLRDCAPVMSLIDTLHKPLKPSVVQFLRAQQCGFHDGYPKICCGVLPKTLNIFNRAQKLQRPQTNKQHKQTKEQQHEIKLNRAPPTLGSSGTAGHINKLSVYHPEATDINNPPHFDITVSTAPPGASTVPYLNNLQRNEHGNDETIAKQAGFLNTGEVFKEAMSEYMAHYDLQRTRRSGALQNNEELDIEVR